MSIPIWGNIKPSVGFWQNYTHPLSQGLIWHWLFNEGAWVIAKDINKNLNGTLTNWPIWTNGKFWRTIWFDGVDDYVEVPYNSVLSMLGDMTICLWIKVTDFANYNWLVWKTSGSWPAPYDFYLWQTSGLPTFFRGSWGTYSYFPGTTAPALGIWQHVAITVNGTVWIQYLNGAINGSGALTATPIDGWRSLRIGTRDDLVTKMKGSIDDVRIYNRGLSQQEIRRIYTEPFVDILSPNKYQLLSNNVATIVSIPFVARKPYMTNIEPTI